MQKGWEFGFNCVGRIVDGDDRFRLKADYFTMDVENYITGCPDGGGTLYFCNAEGQSTVQAWSGTAADAGFVFAGACYTYTQTDLPSQTAGFGAQNFLPEHVAIGSVGFRLLDGKLTSGTRVSYSRSPMWVP